MIGKTSRSYFLDWAARHLTLRRKLMAVAIAALLPALLLSALGMAYYQYVTERRELSYSLHTLTNVIADNAAPALIFGYPESGEQTLHSLQFEASVVAASLYDTDGALFAQFVRDSLAYAVPPDLAAALAAHDGREIMLITEPVVVDGIVHGHVFIAESTATMMQGLWTFALTGVAMFLLAIGIVVFLCLHLQRIVTGPVERFLATMRRITTSRDFEIRAVRESSDDIGSLVEGFNGMLDELAAYAHRLRESEERFEVAVRGAGVGIWDWKLGSNEIFFSERFREMLGWDENGAPPTFEAWVATLHPDDATRVQQALSQHLTERTPYDIEYRVLVNREYRWFHARGKAVWSAGGQAERMAGSLADITQLINAEESLRRYFALSKDLMCSTDVNGTFLRVNPAFATTLGYAEAEVLGMTYKELVHADDVQRAHEIFTGYIPYPRNDGVEIRMFGKHRRMRWVAWSAVIMDSGRVFAIGRDVTERQRIQAELHEYAEQLKRSNRDLENFATVASHDLQEPLRKLQAFRDRLLTRCQHQLDDQGRDYLNRMRDAVDRMATLISDLLSFSRVGTRGQPFAQLQMETIATEVLRDLEVLVATTDAEVRLENLPRIEADPLQMRLLIQNLIGNALKFRRDGVRPTVTIRATQLLNDALTDARSTRNEKQYEFVVEDNGIGFEPAYSEKIFQVFQRLHGRSEYEGNGIGLAICKRIVERHRGQIRADSSPGHGTRFIFTLPERQQQTNGEDCDAEPTD